MGKISRTCGFQSDTVGFADLTHTQIVIVAGWCITCTNIHISTHLMKPLISNIDAQFLHIGQLRLYLTIMLRCTRVLALFITRHSNDVRCMNIHQEHIVGIQHLKHYRDALQNWIRLFGVETK